MFASACNQPTNRQLQRMLPFLFALIQIVITGPPPPGTPPSPSEHYVFSGYDYPPEAVRNHWEGTVRVDILVGVDGRPKSCSIIKSSGHKLLDDTTCSLIMTRAKFDLDRDKAGNAIESHFRPPSVKWRLKK
jgi:protein TonB